MKLISPGTCLKFSRCVTLIIALIEIKEKTWVQGNAYVKTKLWWRIDKKVHDEEVVHCQDRKIVKLREDIQKAKKEVDDIDMVRALLRREKKWVDKYSRIKKMSQHQIEHANQFNQ